MPIDTCALARRLGISGLYLFALSGFVNQGGVYAGLGLMLLGILLTPRRAWNTLRGEPLAWLALVLTAYILMRGAATLEAWPDVRPAKILRDTWNLAAVGGLFSLLTAWWLAGDTRRIARVLQLAVLSLLIGVLMGIDWQHFSVVMRLRQLFGMGNGAGVYSLVAITGLLVLRTSPVFEGAWLEGRLAPWIGKSTLALLLVLFIAVFLLSQTRAAWLAALMVLPAALVLLARARAGRWRERPLTGLGLILLAVLVVGATLGTGVVEKRLGVEQGSIALLFDGRLRDLPADSVGLRVRLWQDALQRIGERPLFGWGAGSAPLMIRELGLRDSLTHYHDLYLQLAVELGLVGVALFAAWTLGVVHSARRAWREQRIDLEYLVFVCACVAIFLIVFCFQIRHDDEKGQYLLILIGALALTQRLCRKRDSGA